MSHLEIHEEKMNTPGYRIDQDTDFNKTAESSYRGGACKKACVSHLGAHRFF